MMIARKTAKQIALDELLAMFDESVHDAIKSGAALEGATHVVALEVLQMDSSMAGHRSALVVGNKPRSWTLDYVLDTPSFRLGDVPSRFAYPVAYAPVKRTAEERIEALEAQSEKRVHPCKYGHYDCAVVEGGLCFDEEMGKLEAKLPKEAE